MVDFQTLLAIIPTVILILSLARDWWKDKRAEDLEKDKIEQAQSRQSRADLEDDYARCRDSLRETRLENEHLTQEGVQKSARIEELERFIRLLGKHIPGELP